MSKISVVIPVYNCSEYISEAIDSALSQTYKDIEIIVINDGSTDTTIKVLKRYVEKIKIINQSNLGVSSARNNGSELATGDYLAFLDSDDLWLPKKIEKQVNKINEGYDICYTNRYNIGDIGDLPHVQTDFCRMPEGFIYEQLLSGNIITTSSIIIKKSIFEKLGGFDTKLTHCEDWDLWLRCAEKYNIGVELEPLLKYRINTNSLSRSYKVMSVFRKKVITHALDSEYCRSKPKKFRKMILSKSYSCSAWEAAKSKDFMFSFKLFCKSLGIFPFDSVVWYDFFRLICGRI